MLGQTYADCGSLGRKTLYKTWARHSLTGRKWGEALKGMYDAIFRIKWSFTFVMSATLPPSYGMERKRFSPSGS